MKYDKSCYLDTGFYSDMDDADNKKEKVVKCRKEHECPSCGKKIEIGQYALLETGFMDNMPVSCHTCLNCIDEWLEESGQVYVEHLEHDEERT